MNARNFLLKILANQKKEETAKPEIGLKGFQNNHFCHKELEAALRPMAMNLIKMGKELSNKQFDQLFSRFSKDFVRQVVAHEVGHTLGLRHNFAASTLTNLSKVNWKNIATNYFFTGETPSNLIPAASVMDYTGGATASLLGAHIRLNKQLFPMINVPIGVILKNQ